MSVKVIGAGVGRTGTHSLKQALEQLLGGRCHHMVEIIGDPPQAAAWTDAIEGRDVDWQQILDGYATVVDWPGASFWREISAANPDALVLLSTRDREAWYRSASDTIFNPIQAPPPGRSTLTMPQCAPASRPSGCWNGPSPTAGSRSASDSGSPFPTSPSRSPTLRLRRANCWVCQRWPSPRDHG